MTIHNAEKEVTPTLGTGFFVAEVDENNVLLIGLEDGEAHWVSKKVWDSTSWQDFDYAKELESEFIKICFEESNISHMLKKMWKI
jgi:hypothetical protein